jgi:hypothetical protein
MKWSADFLSAPARRCLEMTPDEYHAANEGTRRSGLKIRAPPAHLLGRLDGSA